MFIYLSYIVIFENDFPSSYRDSLNEWYSFVDKCSPFSSSSCLKHFCRFFIYLSSFFVFASINRIDLCICLLSRDDLTMFNISPTQLLFKVPYMPLLIVASSFDYKSLLISHLIIAYIKMFIAPFFFFHICFVTMSQICVTGLFFCLYVFCFFFFAKLKNNKHNDWKVNYKVRMKNKRKEKNALNKMHFIYVYLKF